MRLKNRAARRQVLECLQDLSDVEFQERVWLRGEGPEVSSFDELVCQLFEDTALGELLELPSSEPVFSRDADEKLRELSQLLDRIPFDVGAKNLLRHPLWERVRAVAGLSALLVESALEGCHRGLPEAHQ